MMLIAIVLIASGCGPAGGGDEATGGVTEPVVEAPRPTATFAPASPSMDAAATPVPAEREPVIAATPGRIIDQAGELSTPDAGTPAGRPAPVLGRQRPTTSSDKLQGTPAPDQLPTGTPAPVPGDGTTGARPTGPTGPSIDDGSPQTGPAAGTTVVDSCTPAEVPEFEGESSGFVVAENLYFRTGPGTDCERIGDSVLEAGTEVTVTSATVVREGQDTGWVRVDVDGQEGWVAAEFIEPQSE